MFSVNSIVLRSTISVLPCFSKILERIMYNRLQKHLSENNLLFERQFGFQSSKSTEHAILELSDEILNSFEKNNFTVGVFIDLSKAFDTVNNDVLIKKLSYYGINTNNLAWFSSYLRNRQQYISADGVCTESQNITCEDPSYFLFMLMT